MPNWQRQTELGLPPEHLAERRLAFDPSTMTIVLSCTVTRAGLPLPQVYLRSSQDARYVAVHDLLRPLMPTSEMLGVGPALVTNDGSAYVCLGRYEEAPTVCAPTSARALAAIRSIGIARIELRDHSLDLWHDASWFPLALLQADQQAGVIFAVVGERGRDGAVSYTISRLLWATREIQVLAPFAGAFF